MMNLSQSQRQTFKITPLQIQMLNLLHSQRSSIAESLKVIQSLKNSEDHAKSEQDTLSSQAKY